MMNRFPAYGRNGLTIREGLTDEQTCRGLLMPIRDLDSDLGALQHRYDPRMCVLPNGPETIPTLHIM